MYIQAQGALPSQHLFLVRRIITSPRCRCNRIHVRRTSYRNPSSPVRKTSLRGLNLSEENFKKGRTNILHSSRREFGVRAPFRDHREAAKRDDHPVFSVKEYCIYPVFDARSFRAVSPMVGLENSRNGWVNEKDRAESWNHQHWVHSDFRVQAPVNKDEKFLSRASQYRGRLGQMFQHYHLQNFQQEDPK